MLHPIQSNAERRRSAFTLVEVTISSLLLSVLVLGMTFAVHMEARSLRDFAQLTNAELRAEEMLDRLEESLSTARSTSPRAFLATNLGAGADELVLDGTEGFPDRGTLLIGAGTANEERIQYTGMDPANRLLTGLERGADCTLAASHLAGDRVYWSSFAEPIENQINPAANLFDGISQELFGDVFFRGDGSGFVFRSPVDPADTGSPFEDGDLRMGAQLVGGDDVDGWSAIYFDPVATITEADRGVDVNRDGDRDDVFDLGSLRQRSWRASDADPDMSREVGLCPSILLQERCAWGGDLDGDGFSDPIFLWDARSQRLRIRLHVLTGTVDQIGVVSRKELALFLRNADTN